MKTVLKDILPQVHFKILTLTIEFNFLFTFVKILPNSYTVT